MFFRGTWVNSTFVLHGFLLFIILSAVIGWEESENIHYTNSWAVHLENGDTEVANRIAKRHGFINLGQVGSLPGYYHFVHEPVKNRRKRREIDKTELLLTEKEVKWVEQQQVLERDKRSTVIPDFVGISHPGAVTIQDPLFKDQWYLSNIGQSSGPPNLDINILPVWAKGITGRGVVVAILDDGLDYTHPDLSRNYDSKASYDFNDYDNDPMPRIADPNNCHGTKCAGQVAAESGNGICGVGVAFNSSIGGIRMLDGNTTDTIEGSSLSFRNNYIHIYSCAWGPKDDGKRFGRPGTLASKALELGTKEGRGGLGSIFVWATGNGGLTDDDCNCDGYTTSIHTISIGAISDHGLSTYYTESCASTLAVTYSGGSHREKRENKIITTTLNHKCTDKFKGTSSAAPLAAGMIALMLESNPKLTWRDVQNVIVETALMTSPLDEGWRRNGAGKWFNQKFGFGRMDASQLVEKAKNWDNIADQRKCWADKNVGPWKIPESGTVLVSSNTSACSSSDHEVRSLEHVQLVITLKHRHRGHLSIELISPSGTRSQILKTRRNDHSNKGLKDWIFMSVHFWGEDPRGTWTLAVTDNNNNNRRHYRSKMKHGDLEDATEALQDELMGKPRPDDEDTETSSQEHEGVVDKNKEKLDSKLSEDFEGGIFEDETYRNTRKERAKEEAKNLQNKRKKERKEKNKNRRKKKSKHHHRHHHHKHHQSHKKDKPTVAVKHFTRIPTLFGKTFEDLTKQKQAPATYKSTERPANAQQPNYNAQKQLTSNLGPNQKQLSSNLGSNQTASTQGWNQSQFQPVSSQGFDSPTATGLSPDQTLKPTTRQNFGHQITTPTSSQHDMIQNLVKSVLTEMFSALRAQRNGSGNEFGLGQTFPAMEGNMPAKAPKEPTENFSSSLSKAWRKEKGVQKINTLLGILDKVRNISSRVNTSEAANNTRGDEMVTDVLKVLRDILSAGKGDDKTKDFKARVSKLVEDSSNETRNLTQKLFDDLEPGADSNRTSIVINDALSLISAIFEGDSQKKKNLNPVEATATGTKLPEQIGIVLQRQDGSLFIPNTMTTGIQMQTGPGNIVKTWANASQIETVRIEHTKVSPVNIMNLGANESRNKSEGFDDIDMASNVKGKERNDKQNMSQDDAFNSEDENKIDFEIERSGEGKEKSFDGNEENDNGENENENTSKKKHEHETEGEGSILNMRTMKKGADKEGKSGFVSGKKYHNFGAFSHNFIGRNEDGSEINPDRDYPRLGADEAEMTEKAESNNANLKSDSSKPNPDSDEQIDVTVVFDDDKKNVEFMKEVKKENYVKVKKAKEKPTGLQDLEEFTVQKPTRAPRKKPANKKARNDQGHRKLNVSPRFSEMNLPFQPGGYDDNRDEHDDDDNSRSKGEIPENEADEEGDNEESSTNMYDVRDMQSTLPFYPLPVPDQRGYGLLTQVLGPYQDAAFSQGIDMLNAIEQEPLIEDNRDFYEPNYRHEWKRSLPETFQSPTTKAVWPIERNSHIARSRNRRSYQARNLLQLNSPLESAPFSKRAIDIASAKQRLEDLVDMVHRNPAKTMKRFDLDSARVANSYIPKDASYIDTVDHVARHRRRRSAEEPNRNNITSVAVNTKHRRRRSAEEQTESLLDTFKSKSDITGHDAKIRSPRSLDKTPSSNDQKRPEIPSNTFQKTVYREKRDKIIDDYDEGDSDDDNMSENEPHVVKRSAIFSELRPSKHSKRNTMTDYGDEDDSSGDSKQLRLKRDSEQDYESDSDEENGDARSPVGKRKISSLESALRKKVLSMRTQSKSVMKLLRRVHDDISYGDISDLRDLETKIAGLQKKQSKKPSANRKQQGRSKFKLKAKSVTPRAKPKENDDNNINNNNEDNIDSQEKLAYKQDPDEYLKYGTGNTGGLESWTLVFYGT